MATRTKRIELRADPVSEERIVRAASAQNLSVSTFVLGAATREAERVLGRADHTLMPAAQFDALVGFFDQSGSAPRLQQAAAAKRHFRGRGNQRAAVIVPADLVERYEKIVDREDGRIAAERLADLDAGRVPSVPAHEVTRALEE